MSSELFLNHFAFKEKSAPLWCMSMVQWEEFHVFVGHGDHFVAQDVSLCG